MPNKLPIAVLLTLVALFLPRAAAAQEGDEVRTIDAAAVTLANVFSDHAVVQRGVRLPIYGTAGPGETVTVTLAGQTAEAVADDEGRWRVTLEPLAAGGPHELVAETESGRASSEDVLAGDVWLCSGQSNMEWPVSRSDDAQAEIAAADFSMIRLLTVPKLTAATPQAEQEGTWELCSPESIGDFSAVGYFMGRALHREAGVPIGLVDSSWGGTPVEAWMTDAAMAEAGLEDRLADARPLLERIGIVPEPGPSLTVADDTSGWSAADYDDAAWTNATLPGIVEGSGPQIDGVYWIRRSFDLPAEPGEGEATLSLGPIDDFDETYVNGELVGQTGRETEAFYAHEREYTVPAGLLKRRGNVIAVRITDIGGEGGPTGEASQMMLTANGQEVPLAGRWRAAWEELVVTDPDAEMPPPQAQNLPTALYNGMIHPLGPLATRGMAWYQGESNANAEAAEYGRRLGAMVAAWRERMPADAAEDADRAVPAFLIVQLANFQGKSDEADHTDGWAVLREQQRLLADALDAGGLAVTVDVGDANDIHPTDKQSVGERLALLALREAYGREDGVFEGPRVASIERDGDALVLTFNNADGLEFRGDEEKAFAVAGEDGKWAWATPTIDGDSIRLAADDVEAPTRVRFGWSINPNATLHNAAGLPATPFEVEVDAAE